MLYFYRISYSINNNSSVLMPFIYRSSFNVINYNNLKAGISIDLQAFDLNFRILQKIDLME